jgi:uracil-DNA glycosylase
MKRQILTSAIRQTLENYQRCGLSWLPSGADLSDAELYALELLDEPTAAASFPEQAPDEQAPVVTAAKQTQAVKNQPAIKPTLSLADSIDTAELRIEVKALSSLGQQPQMAGQWGSADLADNQRLGVFEKLRSEIRECRRCTNICDRRNQTVFGVGPIRPTVCFMGEAPGADEDSQGEPFVGRAGQLLTKIISAMQLKREEVFILNALKCRPPGNRTPSDEEILNCQPYLEAQLEVLQPGFIVCLGSVAARSLLKINTPVGQLRGRFYQYRQARVLVTYHPSYLLRNEAAKKLVWQDMQLLMLELGIPFPGKKS